MKNTLRKMNLNTLVCLYNTPETSDLLAIEHYVLSVLRKLESFMFCK